MSLYTQDIQDQVLDNYVALWRHIIGDRRLYVSKKIKTSLSPKKCAMCKTEFTPRSYGAKYCGSQRNRTGCILKMLSIAGTIGGRKVQAIKKYKTLKKLWEQEE